jgi:phospholipid/cholesterol/gamma-HCH transport system ATP-binding protein
MLLTPVVEFKQVYKTFGTNKVLQGLDLKVPPGRITFIIGRSGEGKSVTLKHIVGILRPDRGQVFLQGRDMTQASEKDWIEARQKMGLLFQDGALFDSLSVSENVAFALNEKSDLTLKQKNDRILELLEMVGLPNLGLKFPPELSIGEKKRVGLARALALNPALLMYDEPTTGMDSLVSELIDELIAKMQKSIPTMTSVVISHDMGSILKVAHNIIFLHDGKLLKEGTPDEFRASTDPILKQFMSGSSQGPLSRPIA